MRIFAPILSVLSLVNFPASSRWFNVLGREGVFVFAFEGESEFEGPAPEPGSEPLETLFVRHTKTSETGPDGLEESSSEFTPEQSFIKNSLTPLKNLHVKDKVFGAFFGALIADSLALASHLETDAKEIKLAHGGQMISEFLAPGERMESDITQAHLSENYGAITKKAHPGEKRGGQTESGKYFIIVCCDVFCQI